MSEYLAGVHNPLHDVITACSLDGGEAELCKTRLEEGRWVDIWLGDYFLDDLDLDEQQKGIAAKIEACMTAFGPDIPIVITGQHRLNFQGEIKTSTSEELGKVIQEAAAQDFDIESNDCGFSLVFARAERGEFTCTIIADGDFWTDLTWHVDGEDDPVEDCRLTSEQREIIEDSNQDPVTSEIGYKLSFAVRLERKERNIKRSGS